MVMYKFSLGSLLDFLNSYYMLIYRMVADVQWSMVDCLPIVSYVWWFSEGCPARVYRLLAAYYELVLGHFQWMGIPEY
jgi:hypothetical protein